MYNIPINGPINEFHFKKMKGRIERRLLLSEGMLIGKYEIIECIGRGGYCDVYSVTKRGESKVYAMKVEDKFSEKNEGKDSQFLSLNKEIKCINELQDSLGIPRFYDSGETDRYIYYVMELLGPSISTIRKALPYSKFTISTTLRVGIKMLRIIQNIHLHGFVHCDVKPCNFLLRPDCLHFLVLSDFGLMKLYMKENVHISLKNNVGFNGTKKYASLNSLLENTLSRKDDLLSWIYSLYEMKNGYLPWNVRKSDEMKNMKKNFAKISFFNSMPSEIQNIFFYIDSLSFEDEPNYDWIIDSILVAMNRLNIKTTDPFDWEIFSDERIKTFSPIAELPKSTWCIVKDPKPILKSKSQNDSGLKKYILCLFCNLCCIHS